jgi:hypothetical protein
MPVIRPAELPQVGGPVTLAFLTCPRCIWEINQVQLDKPPWSGSRRRFRCPGCRGAVQGDIHGPAWRSSYAGNDRKETALAVHDPTRKDPTAAEKPGSAGWMDA